jgi:hypothetical protein
MKTRIFEHFVIFILLVLTITVPLSVFAEEVEVIEYGVADPQNEAPVLPLIPVEFEIVGSFIKIAGMDQEVEIIQFENGDDMVIKKEPGRESVGNEIEIVHSTRYGSIQISVDLDVPQGCGECRVEEQ